MTQPSSIDAHLLSFLSLAFSFFAAWRSPGSCSSWICEHPIAAANDVDEEEQQGAQSSRTFPLTRFLSSDRGGGANIGTTIEEEEEEGKEGREGGEEGNR